MSSTDPLNPRPRSVFLSYASGDRPAAQRVRDVLRGLGLDVWYDESDLTGGDAWDQKIRRQIRECDFFMPVISAQTEARSEGYFRREWRLAVERTLDMADDHTFLLPVVIDDTKQTGARVPEKFLQVQWSRLPGGQPTPAFEALCRRLAAGESPGPEPAKQAGVAAARIRSPSRRREYPAFPSEEPGQRTRFLFHVAGWALHCAWVAFSRLPKWIRVVAYAWLFGFLFVKACSSNDSHVGRVDDSRKLSPAATRRLQDIAENYKGSTNPADIAKMATQIAQEVSKESGERPAIGSPLLAVPFTAPTGDAAAQKVADSTFAQVYGTVAVSHRGLVGIADQPLPSVDQEAALQRARANHSNYVLYGAIEAQEGVQNLTVRIAGVEEGAVVWSQSYPVAGADAGKIAADVDSRVPDLDKD